MSSKKIELLLMQGEPSGIWRCTVSGWNGLALRIPREMIPDCKEKEFSTAGVYFLIGKENPRMLR